MKSEYPKMTLSK